MSAMFTLPVRIRLLPRAAVLSLLSFFLSACAGSGDITQLDRDTYMVTAQSRLGNAAGAAAGVRQADAYCKERGKRMQMTGAETSDGVIGIWPSKSVVMFKCVA
jgi:hypothetical protein